MCLTVILFSKLRVYCSKEMDVPIFLICSTLFCTEVRLPTYQPDLPPPWDPHPLQCSHSHFSWDYSLGLLQVYVYNCHILLSVQFLLYYLPLDKHPIRCSSSLSKLQLFFDDFPLHYCFYSAIQNSFQQPQHIA